MLKSFSSTPTVPSDFKSAHFHASILKNNVGLFKDPNRVGHLKRTIRLRGDKNNEGAGLLGLKLY